MRPDYGASGSESDGGGRGGTAVSAIAGLAATATTTATATATATTTATAGYEGRRGGAPVVSFENVSKHYGRLKAVDGLSLDLRAGETVALLGPNGAGKSTSLDMLLALRKPTAGVSACSAMTRTTRSSPAGSARCSSPAG